MRRVHIVRAGAAAALLLAACDSPYQHRGMLSDDVSERLRTMDPAALDTLGDAPPVPVADAKPPSADELTALQPGQRKQPLDLTAVRASVLENNLGIRVSRLEPAIASERVQRERAKYEWTFGLIADGGRDVDFAPPLQQELWNGSVRPNLNIPLATGGTLDVDWKLMYFNDQLNSLVPGDNDGWQSVPRISMAQPLLRGGGRLVSENSILVAEFGQRRIEIRTRMAVHQSLVDAERAYWRAYGASRAFEIALESYRRAEAQVGVAERLAQAKLAAPAEITKAKYLAISQIDQVIRASELFRSRSRLLKQAMNRTDIPMDDSVVLELASGPELVQYRFKAETVLDTAYRQRTELLEAEFAIAESTLGVQVAQNGLMPRLDAFGTVAPTGFGQSLGTAIVDTGTDSTTAVAFNAGLRLQVPLGNEAAKADMRAALYQRLKELATARDRRLSITREVWDSISRTNTGWQSVLATRQGVALAGAAYDGVRRLYEKRAATITDLTQSLLQLADAQRAETVSVVEYQLALLDLTDAAGLVPGRAGLSYDAVPLPAPESGEPGSDPDAFLRLPPPLLRGPDAAPAGAPAANAAPVAGPQNASPPVALRR